MPAELDSADFLSHCLFIDVIQRWLSSAVNSSAVLLLFPSRKEDKTQIPLFSLFCPPLTILDRSRIQQEFKLHEQNCLCSSLSAAKSWCSASPRTPQSLRSLVQHPAQCRTSTQVTSAGSGHSSLEITAVTLIHTHASLTGKPSGGCCLLPFSFHCTPCLCFAHGIRDTAEMPAELLMLPLWAGRFSCLTTVPGRVAETNFQVP